MASNGWRDNKGIDDHAGEFWTAYQKRQTDMDDVFNRTLKVVDEMTRRIEKNMFEGLSYKDPNRVDPKILKAIAELGRVVNALHTSHARIIKTGMENAKKMSTEERIQYCVEFLSSLPKHHKSVAARDLKEVFGEW